MKKAILGRKIGMTQIFLPTGEAVPVTVIQAGPCVVTQVKRMDTDGYSAVQVGFEPVKEMRVNKPVRGHFTKSNLKPTRFLRELRLDNSEDFVVGHEIKADVFVEGEHVDVTGITKGKGFAGSVERHGFSRGPMTHGSKYHRGPGSLQMRAGARVFKGRKLPGQYGRARRTVQNLLVVKVDAERNLILVKGAVPGPRRSLVTIKNSVKA